MFEYFVILLVSLVNCFIGFGLECTNGNIIHLKNGREPNAGACIFPTIPVIPAFWLGVFWLLDSKTTLQSFWAVIFSLITLIVFKLIGIYLGHKKIQNFDKQNANS